MAPSIVQVAASLFFIASYASVDAVVLNKRAAVVPTVLSGTWAYQGCYTDPGPKTLTGSSYVNTTGMTDESCISYCDGLGYYYAGTEYSQECYCGTSIASTGTMAATSDCSMTCTGNSTEICGGPSRLSVFWNGKNPPPGPSTDPGTLGYGFFGCYTEGTNGRALTQFTAVTGGQSAMTVALCISACKTAGYTYAGIEYADECYCDNSIQNAAVVAPEGLSGCNMLCAGNSSEYCGAGNRLDIYKFDYTGVTSTSSSKSSSSSSVSSTLSSSSSKSSSASSTSASVSPTLAVKPTIGLYTFAGCYTEGTNVRALSGDAFYDYTAMTLEACAINCAGFTYWGVEYGGECYCGNSLGAGSILATNQADCSFTCPGNAYEYCGAGNRLEMYSLSGGNSTGSGSSTISTASSTSSSITVSSTSVASSISVKSSSSSSQTSSATGLPTGWKYDGCYSEGTTGRALQNQQPDSQTNSVESCIKTCIGLGYSVAGMEYGTQCFCDNYLYNGAALTASSNCNMACPGNSAEICGNGNYLSIYHTGNLTVYAPPAAQKTNLPGSWTYQGCYNDNINNVRALFWQNILTNNNTATSCLSLCAQFGYMAAGMEYGDECYCGDDSALIASGSTIQPETDCQVPCSGNSAYYCGGGSRLSYYKWTGTPLYTWNTPTGNAAGSYQFLIGGVVVPLITTVGINNKVVFMEKSGTGAPNTTGTYELDLAFVSDFANAWRPLHVKSDIFCSAGVTLPDKAGRQLNIGGWAGASTYGVRLYTPSGSPGVPGTTDWQENVNEVSLLAGRWYPSAMIMTNGSVLVLGGEVGSNSAPTPSCEILPPPKGGYAKYLDWLDRTDPDNLYPFMWVLPSGGIFVVYYNEARIIDEVTFDTIKTLPNLPGSVNNFLAGRTYPLEGTGVMFPQYPPYSDPVTVLVCGGSSNGAAYAIDNCVSTQPEIAAPTWTLERMPSQRVMSCICALPDGTYLILNGAQEGVAGFGLATDPNYNAVLYDPSKPVNSRMSIMATTIVARLYHSEAILLPDGRVLVSGSDPEDGTHPEEYRVEVFNPPYTLSGATAPSFTITNTDWAYGATVSITAKIPTGNLAAVRVSMMAAVSSTHGNSMGQRTLFLTVSCSGTAAAAICQLTTPPSAHVAPPGWYQIFVLDGAMPGHSNWVRVGGAIADAANLGNWPAYSDFTTPGLGAVGS
ncbi:glyoxal oxidase-like protein [Acephala macrosclerotiorum]|nr:glyoxal oxidase-like protein [Acephala macrosclerotiorum]